MVGVSTVKRRSAWPEAVSQRLKVVFANVASTRPSAEMSTGPDGIGGASPAAGNRRSSFPVARFSAAMFCP